MGNDKPAQYILGSNTTELDRIHGIHESTVDYMGTLLLAPINFDSSTPLRILDSGTAAGRWLRDFQLEHGLTHEYIGTDITQSFLPLDDTTIAYRVQDVTKPWPQEWVESFDLVHQRFVLGAVPRQHFEESIANLIGLLKPGGWIQLMESDVNENVIDDNDNPAAAAWELLRQIYLAMGVEPDMGGSLRGCFSRAGLVDVREERFTVPIGARRADANMGKESAETVALTAQQLVAGAKKLGITKGAEDRLQNLPSEMLAELEKKGGSYSVYVIMGRKP